MAPLDWSELMKLSAEELTTDPNKAEELYEDLSEFDPGGEEDPVRLKKLFEVTQAVMIFKGTQAQIAEEELAEAAAKEGKSTAKRDQEIEDLKRELEVIRRENKDLKRFGAEAGGSHGGDQVRFLRDELNTMENQITALTKELKEKDLSLREEKESSERYYKRATEAEQQLRELKREVERLQEDVSDYQRQLESQREALVNRHDEDYEKQEKISHKNKILLAALDENRRLAEANYSLEKTIEKLKEEMKEGQKEIDQTTEKCLQLQQIADEADKRADKLLRENEILKSKVEELMEHVKSKADADDEIMAQLNNEVEKWKEALDEKNQLIMDLEVQIMQLKDRLIAANMDSEKQSVAMLTKAVEEKDKQIESLKKKLDEATYALEENAALIEDVRNDMLKSGKGPANLQQQRILNMQKTLRMHEEQLKEAEARAAKAEDDACAKDKQLSEALERMRQYEAGEYGLAEAVAEIKDLKQQLYLKDRNIEELTQYINRCEMKLNDLYDETEDLRERLGMDRKEPIDLTQYRKKKGLRIEEERALNRILQKEIENLEEERIMLKQQIRKLAQATGQKAVALGLTADDMMEVDRFIEGLKEKRAIEETNQRLRSDADKEHLKIKNIQLDAEVEMKGKHLDKLSTENAKLKAMNAQLEEENKNLEKGLREISSALKEQGLKEGSDVKVIECPTLDRMLAAIDAKNMLGHHDTSLFLKAQVDNLMGHVEELRSELKNARYETTKAKVELEKTTEKMERLEEEVKNLREMGAGALLQTMQLPEGMAVTSSDVITSLNEHLVQVLQELSIKEDTLVKMENALDNYRRKFAVVRHQQSLLYEDYIRDKKEWEEVQRKMEEKMATLEGQREEDQVRIQEFDRLVDTLSKDDEEIQRRLAEMTRKVTVLRVNEKALTRRYTAMQDIERNLRKELNKIRNDMMHMETAVSERLGYLQRHKDMAAFKITALQKALDDCVPSSELDKANKQFTELTEKYRDLLEKNNSLVVKTEQTSGFELELKHLQDENNSMRKDLEIEREKLHTLEVAFEHMRKKGLATATSLTDTDVISISKKLTTLEMKELNERQRAEHATRMYEQQKQTLRTLEDRNFELERKFAELTRLNLEQQKVERELRDELATSVPKSVSDADRRRISELETINIKLQDEASRLKDISEVAMTQVRAMETTQQSRDKEVISLRQQLIDFQAQSDEKTVIGKLHRHIVHLQISEGTAIRKLEDAMKRIIKLEAHILKAEQKIDEKDQTIYHNRLECRSKTKYLKHTIQDMRRKFAGSVPLSQQERFAQNLLALQEEKKKMEEELTKTHEDRMRLEDKLTEFEVKQKGLEELIATLKDGRGAQKVTEWHAKMEAVRLEDLKYKRDIEKLKYQVKFLEGLIKKHEVEVLSLEEEKVKMAREFEDRELEWERREVELERIVATMERQQSEIAGAASQFEEAVGALPDPNWPVPKQLEHAVDTIKRNVKIILDGKAEVEHYKKRVDELEKEVREREREVLARDKIITDLRLRLPATADRDDMIMKVTSKALQSKGPLDEVEDYEHKQAVTVAQSTVNSLQALLNQKEETLQKYQELLQQARDELVSMNRRHEEEMRMMNDKLHHKNTEDFSKFKQTIYETMNKKESSVLTNDQLRKLNELQDVVAEQDNSLAALRDKLTKARQETLDWRYKYDDMLRQQEQEKEKLIEEHRHFQSQLEQKIADLEHHLKDKERELEVTSTELERQKEANVRAPTTSMKNLVERLRNQLELKEKQHKALSKALMELRAEMVQQAQDDVKANMDQVAIQKNVQKVVEKHTKELHERIEELETQNQKLKKELKKRKDKEQTLNVEYEEMRQDLSKRESQVRHLKDDKSRLESEVEELERKIERMGTMQKQKGPAEGVQHELEELRRKNKQLQEELKRSKHQPEKPYEQHIAEMPAHQDQTVARWEESKKWQKMVERLKGRLKEKEQEIERITKSHELAKHALERANKDKEILEHKLRTAGRSTAEDQPIRAVSAPQTAAVRPGPAEHQIQDLKHKNHELQEENTRLRRQLTQSHDKNHEELTMRNKFLSERIQELETRMQTQFRASQEGGMGPGSAAYNALLNKQQEMEKKLLKMSEENIELRFEVEQAKKDIPRLKERISDQQKYIEILKTEKDQLMEVQTIRSQSSLGSSLGSLSANIRRIGESGRSPKELERTIALLKKVVEKIQAENEQLKKAPGVISADQLKALQLENKGLKDQIEDLRQKFGASLSERYQSQQQGTAKIMSDYDKLRCDLMKEKETNEKLRIKLKQKEITIEKLEKQVNTLKEKVETESTKPQSLSAMDSKEWKGVVMGKLNEEKVKALEEELAKKNKMLSDLKKLLREAVEREQELLKQKAQLEKKVALLERCPQGSKVSDTELMKEYQQARLTIERLENEKKELQFAVEMLSKEKQLEGDVDLTKRELLQRLNSYDQMMAELVDVKTQLKSLQLERDQLQDKVQKLTKELENFGPEFFEEIEDLKYNYREAVQRNVHYEEQLSQLSKQFGVAVSIPGL